MNRSELETLVRQADPAAGRVADSRLRSKILAATSEAAARPTPVRRRRGPLVAVAAFAVVIGAVFVPGLLLNRPTPTSPAVSIEGATFLTRYGEGFGGIRGVAVDGDRVWAMSPGEKTLYEIPLDGSEIIGYDIGFYAEGVRLLDGVIWLEGWDPNQIIRLVPGKGLFGRDEITQIPLPGTMRNFGIIVGHELWNSAGGDLVRISSEGTIIDVREGAEIGALATAFGWVWAAGQDGSLQKLDPGTGAVVERFEIADVRVDGIIEGPTSLWVTDSESRSAVSVLPTTAQVLAKVEIGDRPRSLTMVGAHLWVSTFESTLVEIDATTGEHLRTVAMRAAPGFLFTVGDQLGVSLFRSAQIALIDTSRPMLEMPTGPIKDQVVELESGRSVRLRCLGSGTPTILLEADMGEGVESWATVQALLGMRNRVCSSERSGLWSADEYAPAGSSSDAAADLHEAIGAAGEVGPFMLVGNGVGSFVSREFAAKFSNEVVGMVLVDPQPDDFLELFLGIGPEDAVRIAGAGFLEGNENTRLRTTIGNPGGVPATIIARGGDSPFAWVADPAILKELEAGWLEGQKSMAKLLGAGTTTATDIQHVLYDAPQLIVDEVQELIR